MINELADYHTVTERTVYRLPLANKTSAFGVRGSGRSPRTDIDIWIKKHSMESIEATKKDSGEPS
jgi:hypothetical protein